MTAAEELAQYLGAAASTGDVRPSAPMLCEREEAAERILDRAGYLFELKLDGVRIVADKREGRVTLRYRTGRDATESYPEVARVLATLADERVVLDGEIVAFDERGRPDFQRLGHRIQTDTKRPRGRGSSSLVHVVYVVFDVLAVGPYDLRAFPLEARKEILARVVPVEGLEGGVVRVHPTFDSGVALFEFCREQRLEGVVAKKLGSPYRGGDRSIDWLKIKRELDAEFVVVGWTEGEGDRSRLGALELGAYDGDRLVFRGRVGSGLHGAIIDSLLERLLPLEVADPVAQGRYTPKPRRHHCRPEIVVSVRYGGFSVDGLLRFAVFRGVRPDVEPKDCTAAPHDVVAPSPEKRRAVHRIHVTAPTHALLPDGTTNGVLCKYFESVAPAILRHACARVCTLRRVDGTALWPPPKWTPKVVRTTSVKVGRRELRGFLVDSLDALLFSVEAASPSIEHGPRLDHHPEQTDFVALRVRAATAESRARVARAIHEVADEIGLPSAAFSSGVRSIDVRVGLGAAPAGFAEPLGELIVRLATPDANPEPIEVVDTVPLVFTPVVDTSGAVVVAVPLPWDELDEVDLGAIDLEAAAERALAVKDVLDSATADVDVVAATAALERAIAARSLR